MQGFDLKFKIDRMYCKYGHIALSELLVCKDVLVCLSMCGDDPELFCRVDKN